MLSTLLTLALTSQCVNGTCQVRETPLDFRDHTVVVPAPRWFAHRQPVHPSATHYPGAATVAIGGYGIPDLRYRNDFPRSRYYARPVRLRKPLLRPLAPAWPYASRYRGTCAGGVCR